MKKVSGFMLKVFAAGILLMLLAGALTSVGFAVALCIGGETATQICVFIHKVFFPYVIRLTSVFVAFGLVGMYLSKIKALAISDNMSEENEA